MDWQFSKLEYHDDPDCDAEVVTPKLAFRIAHTLRRPPGPGSKIISLITLPIRWLFKLPAMLLIVIYKYFISPLLPPACRFQPSCSVYTFQAIKRYGIFRGGLLGAFRLSRCQPFCRGGYDPVPADPYADPANSSQASCTDPGHVHETADIQPDDL